MLHFPSSFEGVSFVDLPLGDAVESTLRSDFTMNGFYPFSQNKDIRVFTSAFCKNVPSLLDVEIFKNTPDKCWLLAGWNRIKGEDKTLKISDITFFRRIYEFAGSKELCYFAFLIDGKEPSGNQMTKLTYTSFFEKEKSIEAAAKYFTMRLKESIRIFC